MGFETGGNPLPGTAIDPFGEGDPVTLKELYTLSDDEPRREQVQHEGGVGGQSSRNSPTDHWQSELVSAGRQGLRNQAPTQHGRGLTMRVKRLVLGLVMVAAGVGTLMVGMMAGVGATLSSGSHTGPYLIMLAGLAVAVIGFIVTVTSFRTAIRKRGTDEVLKGR
jgi:hypothetical protein